CLRLQSIRVGLETWISSAMRAKLQPAARSWMKRATISWSFMGLSGCNAAGGHAAHAQAEDQISNVNDATFRSRSPSPLSHRERPNLVGALELHRSLCAGQTDPAPQEVRRG